MCQMVPAALAAHHLQRLVVEDDVTRTERLEPGDQLIVGGLMPSRRGRGPDNSDAPELEDGAELDEDLPYRAVGRVDHHGVAGLIWGSKLAATGVQHQISVTHISSSGKEYMTGCSSVNSSLERCVAGHQPCSGVEADA